MGGGLRGAGGFALVIGESGIGKTRLASEFALRLEGRGRVLWGSMSYPERAPYQAVSEVFRAALGFIDPSRLETTQRALLSLLLPEIADTERSETAPSLGQQMKVFDAAANVLRTLAKERPALIVFEELHNAGPATLAMVEYLKEACAESPILIVAVTRSSDAVSAADSGTCAVTAHAILWQTGSMVNLGSLGGSYNNAALNINNRSQIVGYSDLSGDTATHAFLWQSGTMSDLGTLPGDTLSVAYGINDKGQVVGESCNASSCRGFIWQNGSMTDLNLLVPPNGNLYVLYGSDINNAGHISGAALNLKGLERAVVLVPDKKAAVLPTGVSAPKFATQQSVRIQPRNESVAPAALRKSIFSL